MVRTDQGTEYRGHFTEYLLEQGIAHRRASTMHPRSNSMAERAIATIKAALRRYLDDGGGRWWEALPDIARAMRTTPTRATGLSPHT